MGFFPLYREDLLTGPSHVSLALPGIPSKISSSVGATSSTLLLIPNIDFLNKFIEGDLGISDNMWKGSLFTNINSEIASTQESVFRKFSEINDIGLTDLNKYKKDGKFKLPLSEINVSSKFDGLGLKAFEKATLKSIFETQKPYMEIAKTVLDVLVDVEDIVARVMPLVSLNPLKHKSEKPIVNGGNGTTPKAIGFKNGLLIKSKLAELDKISKTGSKKTINKDGSVTSETKNTNTQDVGSSTDSIANNKYLTELSKTYKIVNVVYSTGNYDPKVDYIYSFIELPPDPEKPANAEPSPNDDDPYNKWKPDRLIFGIFNSKGVPLNPNDFVKTVGYSGNQLTENTTPYKKAEWITKSSKWKFKEGEYVWPTFGAPNYVFTNGLKDEVAKTAPNSKYDYKRYKKGDKNILNGNDAIEGNPIINGFDSVDQTAYNTYFTEYTNTNLKLQKDLTEEDIKEAQSTILSQLNINSHLENITLYGQNKCSVYKDISGKPAFPETMKVSFKPRQIQVEGAKADPSLSGLNGMIWIDPDADYDMKVIRIDPVLKKKTVEPKSEPKLGTEIKSFVKNYVNISLSDNSKFNIDIRKNNTLLDSLKDVTTYKIENWNYENGKLVNNSFRYDMWTENPIFDYKNITKKDWYDITIYKDTEWRYAEYDFDGGLIENLTGYKLLGDNSTWVYVSNGVIKKWYYDYNRNLASNSTGNFKMPNFGVSKNLILNVSNGKYQSNDTTIPVYSLKVNDLNGNGYQIIDPSKINNSDLSKDGLLSSGKYGVGDSDNPQEIEILERYQLTDLDTESYYIIEGIRIDKNTQDGDTNGKTVNANANGDSGSKWYKLPHAIGATTVFIKMLVKVFSKLIPAINKLINLLKDPLSFITDIISEKLGESFTFLSKSAINTYKSLSKTLNNKEEILKAGGAEYIKKLKLLLKDSPLTSFTFMNNFGIPNVKTKLDAIQNSKVNTTITNNLNGITQTLTSQASKISSNLNSQVGSILNKDTTLGGNLVNQATTVGGNLVNQANVIGNNLSGSFNSITNKLNTNFNIPPILKKSPNFGDINFILDGVGFIPFSIFGKDLSFGMELKMSNLLKGGAPLGLVFNKSKNSKDKNSKDTKNGDITPENKSNSFYKDPNNLGNKTSSGGGYTAPNKQKSGNNESYYITSTWYSTGQFINGVDYNYIYITEDNEKLLKEIDDLVNSDNPDDLTIAKQKLDEAIKKDPTNETLKDKLKEIKNKINDISFGIQPILKLILSLVTLPIKVIADVVKWILDFFKSLTNPLTLPSKIAELLSFKWIMKFFTPKGILDTIGLKFNPDLITKWTTMATQVSLPTDLSINNLGITNTLSNLTKKATNFGGGVVNQANNIGGNLVNQATNFSGNLVNKATNVGNNLINKGVGIGSNLTNKMSNVKKLKGFALPDDYELADLSQFLSAPFLATLPTYTAGHFRDMIKLKSKFPFNLFYPILCFIEKMINAFIDFVWSTLGIEVIIPPPHIKLCSKVHDPSEITKAKTTDNQILKTVDGQSPTTENSDSTTTEIVTTDPYTEKASSDSYLYEVKLPSGEVKTFIDRVELDKFMEENKNLNFDLEF